MPIASDVFYKNRRDVGEKPKFSMSLQSWLDRLMRTNYAVANVVKDAVDKGDFTPFRSLWKGLSGEEKTLFRDVLTEMGWQPTNKIEEVAKFMAGLSLDVFLDPITYIGIGGLTKAGKLAQRVGKLAPTITKQAALGQKALLQFGARPIVKGAPVLKGMARAGMGIRRTAPMQALGKAFVPGFRPTGVSAEAWKKLMAAKKTAKNITRLGTEEAGEFATGILKDINKLKKTGITDLDINRVVEAVERRAFGTGLPKGIKPIWDKLIKFGDDVATRRKGIGKTLLNDGDYNYWLHTLSLGEMKSLNKLGLDIGFREYTTKTASDITRKYVRVTSPKGRSFISRVTPSGRKLLTKKGYKLNQASIADVNKFFKREFFSTDLPYTAYTMGRRIARQEGGQTFFSMSRDLGSKEAMEGWVKSTAPELYGLHFNPKIAGEIDKIRKVFVGEPQAKEFLRWFDKVQNTWKLWTLGVFPAYHFRNIIGNTWNNYLAGVVNPADLKIALKIQHKQLRKIPLSTAKIPGIGLSEMGIWKLARYHEVMGRGIMRAEPGIARGAGIKPTLGRRLGTPAIKGMRMGGHIEDNARLWHFVDRLRKGWVPDQAAVSVKKYLFDYTELTDFELNVMRRLLPFYTWTRKNIPLQLESLVKTPGRPLLLEKARQGAYKAAGEPPEQFMPDWVRERMPFFLGKQKREYTYFPLESWIPFADLMKITPERAKDIIGELLSPIIKIPLELSINKVFYFNSPIENYKGEQEEFLKTDMPAWMAYLGRNIRVLNEINRMIGFKRHPKTAPPAPSKLQKGLRVLTGIKAARYDLRTAIRGKKWEIKQELEKLRIGFSRAKKYGRKEEMERIWKKLQGLTSYLESI